MTMQTRKYTLEFLTPAFLGDADQNGRWRTPPFKHLLRAWWRVAWAMDNDPANWRQMRHVEGRLLGHAWLEEDRNRKGEKVAARQSRLRMRLSDWKPGTLDSLPQTQPAGHRAPASAFYLGYGPVEGATALKMEHPLAAANERAGWSLAWPEEAEGAEYLQTALALIHQYGTLGGRSRNGWGSLALKSAPVLNDQRLFRPWKTCLKQQWAHAIGRDESGPLVWRLPSRKEWKRVIEDLAAIRKTVNSLANDRSQREILNQPVGGQGERVPSNLRFKVRRDEKGLHGVIFHMPCRPPEVNDARGAERIWKKVHDWLDNQKNLERRT